MSADKQLYRPLFRRRWWFGLGRVRAWRGEDHLLIVETRFFWEHYTRVYWADIESILLYSLHVRPAVLTALEAACVMAALTPAIVPLRNLWALLPAILFVVFYAAWRFARPNWGCQVTTRISSKRFAIPGTQSTCRRIVIDLKNSIAMAQRMTSEQTTASDGVVTAPTTFRSFSRGKEPITALHVLAFVLGLLSSIELGNRVEAGVFHMVVFVCWCTLLAVTYFFERNFEFPFAVRSAAVMSRMLVVMQILFWILAKTRLSYMLRLPFEYWQFGLPRVVLSLYGIVAVLLVSTRRTKAERKTSTVLGLS